MLPRANDTAEIVNARNLACLVTSPRLSQPGLLLLKTLLARKAKQNRLPNAVLVVISRDTAPVTTRSCQSVLITEYRSLKMPPKLSVDHSMGERLGVIALNVGAVHENSTADSEYLIKTGFFTAIFLRNPNTPIPTGKLHAGG